MRPTSLQLPPPPPIPDVVEIAATAWSSAERPALRGHLEDGCAVALRSAWSASDAAAMAGAVLSARERWTSDFGGEQFSLGSAFYTHLETGRAAEYFARCAASDALVESVLPGAQSATPGALRAARRGPGESPTRLRKPGVHVFPAGSKVARRGGVPHWDVEGLAPEHLSRQRDALSLVVMLQPPSKGGALRLWDACWDGHNKPSSAALRSPRRDVLSGAGDAVLLSSYRLHQIRSFRGRLDRISITAHGVEVDPGIWEFWF